MRESIQSHRNLTWVFAGSHEIEELTAALWTSIWSGETVEVPPFNEAETRILLTEPLKDSTLWPSGRERPHFSPAFWGEEGFHGPLRSGWLAAPGAMIAESMSTGSTSPASDS